MDVSLEPGSPKCNQTHQVPLGHIYRHTLGTSKLVGRFFLTKKTVVWQAKTRFFSDHRVTWCNKFSLIPLFTLNPVISVFSCRSHRYAKFLLGPIIQRFPHPGFMYVGAQTRLGFVGGAAFARKYSPPQFPGNFQSRKLHVTSTSNFPDLVLFLDQDSYLRDSGRYKRTEGWKGRRTEGRTHSL